MSTLKDGQSLAGSAAVEAATTSKAYVVPTRKRDREDEWEEVEIDSPEEGTEQWLNKSGSQKSYGGVCIHRFQNHLSTTMADLSRKLAALGAGSGWVGKF